MSMRSRGSACLGSASLGLCLFLQEHRGRRTRSWRTSLTTSLHRPERWQLRTVSLCSWGGVRADDRTFPSCVLILFCFFILVFFLHIFLSCFLFFSFLFMSLTHTPSTSPVFSLCQISHGGCPPPPRDNRWASSAVGVGADEYPAGHNMCDSFLLTFSPATPHFSETPTSSPPAYRGCRQGRFLNTNKAPIKFHCQFRQHKVQHF